MPKAKVLETRIFHPDTGNRESHFRERVRDILNLPWDTRDEQLFQVLQRLVAKAS